MVSLASFEAHPKRPSGPSPGASIPSASNERAEAYFSRLPAIFPKWRMFPKCSALVYRAARMPPDSAAPASPAPLPSIAYFHALQGCRGNLTPVFEVLRDVRFRIILVGGQGQHWYTPQFSISHSRLIDRYLDQPGTECRLFAKLTQTG